MKTLAVVGGVSLVLLAVLAGCSDDDSSGVTPTPDSGVTPGVDASTGGNEDAAVPATDSGSDAPAAQQCTAAKEQLLKPIDTVSSGTVIILADEAGIRTVFVDATAGGSPASAATNPRIYLNLDTLTRVEVTDKTAEASTGWDLALKRAVLFTNSGDGGPGTGGAVFLEDVAFDTVTATTAATLKTESFFLEDCKPNVDQVGSVATTFDGWYEYGGANNKLTPFAGTWVVKGGTGKLFKVQILDYYSFADGGTNGAAAAYTLKVGAL